MLLDELDLHLALRQRLDKTTKVREVADKPVHAVHDNVYCSVRRSTTHVKG